MFFWEKNREILLGKYGGLLNEISSEDDDLTSGEFIIETTPSGEPSLCFKGLYVHSMRDPVREGSRLAEAVKSENGIIVILGFGLGYTAQAAAKLGRPVIIVEKYRSLLRTAMELRDLTGLLSAQNIIFIVGGSGEGITDALSIAAKFVTDTPDTAKNKPSVIRNRTLTDLDKEWYSPIEDKIRTWVMRDEVNAATLKRFGRRWVRNLSRNMKTIRDFPGITGFAGLASSCDAPVFLAAAGPSLDMIRPLLDEIYRRFIIVAVDTNLRFFLDNNILPDFVITVDPQFWNSCHLNCKQRFYNKFNNNSLSPVLIAESAVYPSVLNLPFKKIFLCSSLFPLGAFIENRTCPKGRLAAGGSVATSAWDFARTLFSGYNSDNISAKKEIWIAGLDLAYPDLKTHFRGALFEERANTASCRFNPAETWITRVLRDGIPFKTRSCTGDQILTDRRLSLYAAWFENNFRNYNEIRNYAIFQKGLTINGLEKTTAEKLLALPECREKINNRLDTVISKIEAEFHDTEESQKRNKRYENAVSALTRGLECIREAAENGADITRKASYHTTTPERQKKILKDLDEIMRRINNSDVKEVAGFLFPDPRTENTSTKSNDPFRAYLESSYSIFSSLAEAVRCNLEYLM